MELSIRTFFQIFHAGLVSTIAPCSWLLWVGILIHWSPYYLLTNRSLAQSASLRLKYAVILWIGFIFGFSILGCLGTGITSPLGPYHSSFRILSGLWMILTAYGFYRSAFQKDSRVLTLTAFITGAAIACSWIPCVNPILGNILQEASERLFHPRGFIELAIYTTGLGIPFLVWIAICEIKTIRARFDSPRHVQMLRFVICLAILFYGVLVATGRLTVISRWMPSSWVSIR